MVAPDYNFEVLVRAHFHRSGTDSSGKHNTMWVSIDWLRGLEGEEPSKVKEMMQQYVDIAFLILMCKYEFGIATPAPA